MPASPTVRLRPLALALPAAALLGLFPPIAARAQTEPEAGADAAPAVAAPAPPPGPAYAARQNLGAYVEFDGLDAREDAWSRTAAHRMLNDTSLGTMLEAVGVALLDRAATWLPNRKINGADGVAIVKHVARKGFVAAFHADPSAPTGRRGVLILRGATTKEEKGLLSRLIVSFMDPASKHRLERKGTRSVVIVPPPGEEGGKPTDAGWAWWAEGGDFGIALSRPSDADACLAALDGKVESAVGHEPVEALSKPDDGVTPVLKILLDGDGGAKLLGARRVEYRWGFRDEALVGATRIEVPKGELAFLDDPSFEAKKLLPIPDGVEYFASISLKPERWASLIAGSFAGTPEAKARYDEFAAGVKDRGRSDFESDFLGNLGPRVVAYLAPTTSAATGGPAAAPSLSDPMALLTAMGPQMPRPVIVAEVADPAKFSRALEAVMQEANRQIKAVAAEQIAEALKAQAESPNPGGPGGPGNPGIPGGPGQGPGGGAGAPRAADPNAAMPEFRLLTSTGAATNRTYMLNMPTSSPIKLPAGFRPSVRLEGNYLAVSTSSEAARVAVEQLRKKDWTPPEEIARAIGRAPETTFLFLYGDSREAAAAALAGLPGAIQTGVNTALAASEALLKPQAAGNQPGGPGSSGGYGSGPMVAPGGPGGGPGSSYNPQYSSGMMGSGGPGMGGPQGNQAGQAPPKFSMIQVRVDPASLPAADELKAMMFPSTTFASVEDGALRIVTRGSFPDAIALAGSRGVLPAILTPIFAAARAADAAKAAAEAAEAANAEQQGQGGNPGSQPGGGYPGSQPGGGGYPGSQPGMNPAPGGNPGGGAGSAPGPAKRRRDES